MNGTRLSIFSLALLLAGGGPLFAAMPLPAAAVPSALLAAVSAQKGWELVCADEFDRDGVPSPQRWNYEEGFVRNEELQLYTKSPKNVRVHNGCLVIEARRETVPNPKYREGGSSWQISRKEARYTSGSLTTRGRVSWRYGRIEVRARVPSGKGTWPAIWMLGDNIGSVGYPGCGEIDIMEILGKEPKEIHGTIHYPPGEKEKFKSSVGKTLTVPAGQKGPADGFHIYAIEWNEKEVRWFYDDACYHTFKVDQAGAGPDNPFRKPQYLILNLALGGWGGDVDDAAMPQLFLVDYVRVYCKKEAVSPK